MKKSTLIGLATVGALSIASRWLDGQYILQNEFPVTGKTVAVEKVEQGNIHASDQACLTVRKYSYDGEEQPNWMTWQPQFEGWDPNYYNDPNFNWESPDPNLGWDTGSARVRRLFDNGTNIGVVINGTRSWNGGMGVIKVPQLALQTYDHAQNLLGTVFIQSETEGLADYLPDNTAFDMDGFFYVVRNENFGSGMTINKFDANGKVAEWGAYDPQWPWGKTTALTTMIDLNGQTHVYQLQDENITKYDTVGNINGMVNSLYLFGSDGIVVDPFGNATTTLKNNGTTYLQHVDMQDSSISETQIVGEYQVQDIDSSLNVYVVSDDPIPLEGKVQSAMSDIGQNNVQTYQFQNNCGNGSQIIFLTPLLFTPLYHRRGKGDQEYVRE